MGELSLITTGMKGGVLQALLSGSDTKPAVLVTYLETPLPDVTLTATPDKGTWLLQVQVPASVISDGVQTILVTNPETGARLGSFTIIAGEAVGDDLRAEVDLLRAELDMLKRAFRRHCAENP